MCVLDVLGVTCASCRVSVAGSLTAAVVDGPVSPSGGAGVLASELTSVSWKEGSSSSPLYREGVCAEGEG